jgi:hypothetical protein
LVGKPSRDTVNELVSKGYLGRAFPDTAMILSRFIPALSSLLLNYPITFVGISHWKSSIDPENKKGNILGGTGPGFYASQILKMTRIARKTLARFKESDVKIVSCKGSMGDDANKLVVRFRWSSYTDPTGVRRQTSKWCWGKATIDLLRGLADDAKTKYLAPKVAEIINIHESKKPGGARYWAKELGMTTDGSLSPEEFANFLESNLEISNALNDILGIVKRPVPSHFVDYAKKMREYQEERITSGEIYRQPEPGEEATYNDPDAVDYSDEAPVDTGDSDE